MDRERRLWSQARLSRYRWAVNPADLRCLQEGDLDARQQNLYLLLDRVSSRGDESAAQALRALVCDYRNYHRSLYTRALNQAAVFGDATLEAPLLTALADTQYNCQAGPRWAAPPSASAPRYPACSPCWTIPNGSPGNRP